MATPGSTEFMARHPDILAMRERVDRVGATPVAQAAEGLLFLAAGYAAISGWVVGFNAQASALTVINLIVGGTLMLLTVGFAASYGRTYGMSWVAFVAGVFLIVAPWAVQNTDRSTNLIVSNVIAGGCIALFGLILVGLALAGRVGNRAMR